MAKDQKRINPGMSLAGAVDLESLKHQVKAEPGQQGGAPAAGGYVIDATAASFQAVVQTSTTFPVLLLLWVASDSRLFSLARKLGDAVNALKGKIQLARVDISQDQQVAQAFRVQDAPALFALVAGRPMPILQGMPNDAEIKQVTDTLIPQVISLAQQSGITGSAPYQGPQKDEGTEGAGDANSKSGESSIPPEHQHAHALAQAGDYSGAAQEYAKVLASDPSDVVAARERSKALLLARSGSADVRRVRAAAAGKPDDVGAQLAVADVDMIGGQIGDAFDRLLTFASDHHDQLEHVRGRLLEYFTIPDASDPRLRRARRRLTALLY